MRTVQMTLDDELLERVDNIVKELKTTRSAFTRQALKEAIDRFNVRRMEEMHRKGYQLHPVTQEEFRVWEREQDWGDA
jgi:metal-responsive CopG/Arc/MetJ family transcriptional regulator